MPSKRTSHEVAMRQWIGAAGVIAALWGGGGGGTAAAETLVDPPVFTSQNGVLDIMMVAMPQPIPSISFNAPDGSAIIHPTGWVYQVCPRPASGMNCPSSSSTVSPYGGVRLALQPGDTLKIRYVNRLPKLDPSSCGTKPIPARPISTSIRPTCIRMACSRRRGPRPVAIRRSATSSM